MDSTALPSPASAVVFRDGFGERSRFLLPGVGEQVEALRFGSELSDLAAFEFALRERIVRLATFRHTCFARVRAVERVRTPSPAVALISEAIPGVRLSEVLRAAERREFAADAHVAAYLIRQLMSAVALFHANAGGLAHGAIAPERIVITPKARLVIVEHVMGAAVEELRYTQERYWSDLRVATPARSGDALRLDGSADLAQVALTAIALLIGRPLTDDEYPADVPQLIAMSRVAAEDTGLPNATELQSWLVRMIHRDGPASFGSAMQAQTELAKILVDGDYISASAALEQFVASHIERDNISLADEPAPVCPKPAPVAAAHVPDLSRLREDAHEPPTTVSRKLDTAPSPRVEPFAPTPIEPTPYERSVQESIADSEAFETGSAVAVTVAPWRRWIADRKATAAAISFVVVAGTGGLAHRYRLSPAPAPTAGHVAVTSNVEGADVLVDGQPHGKTPASFDLDVGFHGLDVRSGDVTRSISVTVGAGARLTEYIELPPTGADASLAGQTATQSGSSNSGAARGRTETGGGAMASAAAPVTVADGVEAKTVKAGWISVSAPAVVQLFESGKLIGTSATDRVSLSEGTHQIDVVADTVGYRLTRSVAVKAGKVASVTIEFPKAPVSLNAVPWADVWIDGERAGQTPIGNLPITLGAHDVVFRHPDLGEQRRTVTVSLTSPTRLSVDFQHPN